MTFRFRFLVTCCILAFTHNAPAAEAVTRVACAGTSITDGTGIAHRGTDSYPSRLQALLGKGYLIGNFGMNGATLLEKGDIPYTRQKEFQKALSFHPHIVLIELGTNDSKPRNRVYLQDFEHDYAALIDSFRNLAPNPRIVLLLPPPAFTKDSAGISAEVLRARILPLIRAVAYAKKCELVDLHTMFVEMPEFFPDQVHPSARGAVIMASRLSEFLSMEADTGFSLLDRIRPDGTISSYHGFDCLSFRFDGRDAKVVLPRRVAKDRPWIWRARFWGHAPQTEMALLERGFHLVYCDVAELFGNDEAIRTWERFYDLLTDAGLSGKATLEGFSRGGMYIYRWAAAHPDRVACVYADAPVLDMRSWPGGRGKGHGNPEEWERFKKDFHLATDAEAMAFEGNPIDLAPRLASAGFPMLHVCGDADVTVPIDENTDRFEKVVLAHGGRITVIRKKGIGHVHGLADPTPIVDFILRATAAGGVQPSSP